jgi:T-complex protein 1 subunit eta
MMQPQIIILKEGTDQSQGKGQLISNINACQAVVDTVRTTLGPRGMDKLMVDSKGFSFFSFFFFFFPSLFFPRVFKSY